jgi:hypothetical protein
LPYGGKTVPVKFSSAQNFLQLRDSMDQLIRLASFFAHHIRYANTSKLCLHLAVLSAQFFILDNVKQYVILLPAFSFVKPSTKNEYEPYKTSLNLRIHIY